MFSGNKLHCPIDKHFHSLHGDFYMHQKIQVILKLYYITCTSPTTINSILIFINGQECHSDFNSVTTVESLKNNVC